MTFDFDTLIDRRGTASVKWNLPDPDVIPLWVADMDFAAAPCIVDALQRRLSHPVFGYVAVPDSYYQAVEGWFQRRHHWHINPKWMLYTTGVVPALSAIIRGMTRPGDKVLIQTPVYNCFFSSIRNNQCEIVENALLRTADTFVIDFDALDQQLADPAVKIMLLCNPHNPVGRVWTPGELERVVALCARHNVILVSDEIHNELVMPGYVYTPTASLSALAQAQTITCVSPSKSFNIAGLQNAVIVTSNDQWREQIDHGLNLNEVCDVNPFGVEALKAAYSHGDEWIDDLCQYLWGNYQALKAFFAEHLPQLLVMKLEGTYLAWIDCKALNLTSDQIAEKLLNEGKVWVNSGTMYGQRDGEGYLRINFACPRARLMEGLRRIAATLAH